MHRIFYLGLILFVSVEATAGGRVGSARHSRNYIVGGQEVLPSDPIQASTVGLFEPSGDGRSGSLCSGTLIRRDMVLTAAHCLNAQGPKPTVIFGSDLHSPEAVRRPVEGVAINPAWQRHAGQGMDQGDIALVKMAGVAPKGFHRITAASSDSDLHSGEPITLAGYGISDATRKTGAGRLRKTQVSVLQNRSGKSEMILDQSHGRGACHGDSGGPAFINKNGKMVLAGVTNRGYPNSAPDDCGHQVVYTKVPTYRSWIRKSEKSLDRGPGFAHQIKRRRSSKRRTA